MKLNQITVPSLDIDTSIAFYRKLGLKLIVHSSDHYARFECPDGDSTFSLHLQDKLPEGAGILVYFECDNLEQEVRTLRLKGLTFEDEIELKPWLWKEIRLKDPFQNQIILFEAGENRKDPPWKLS